MKNMLFTACIWLALSCNNATTVSTKEMPNDTASTIVAENKTDWQPLFDGKTTKGWHTYGKTTAGESWQISDGALFVDTTKNEAGDLITNDSYANFDLKLEWKISANGNSGIIFYVQEDTAKYKATYNTGLEMQILDNSGHADGKIIKHRAGDLYDLIKSNTETVKPVGEWNQAEIICNNGKLDLLLNNVNVVSTTLWNDNWKKLVASSKFKNMPNWGSFTSGKIALQHHGNAVWYKNISIKKL